MSTSINTLNKQILLKVESYLSMHSVERPALSLLLYQLQREENVTDRNNFNGHITSSAMVVDQSKSSILAVFNKSLNLWLLPGGHAEKNELPEITAQRELEEETGIKLDQKQFSYIVDINAHEIPANEKKQEPRHWHYDFRFLCHIAETPTIKIQPEEIESTQWINIKDIKKSSFSPSLSSAIEKFNGSFV